MTNQNNNAHRGHRITAMAISLALFTVGSVLVALFARQHIGLLATLLTGAIVSLGVCGSYLIKATWTRIDERSDKYHWTLLDSRLTN